MGVKILFKSTLRTFSKKKFQLLAIGIIIFLSSFLYTTMYYGIDSMNLGLEKLVDENNQEDFSIEVFNGILPSEVSYVIRNEDSTWLGYSLTDLKKLNTKLYNSILKRRKNRFLKVYSDYLLETREYKDLTFNHNGEGNKIRFLKDSKQINLTFMEQGVKPKKNREIAVSRVYAVKNNLKIGDILTIKEKDYKITGFVLFPDYIFPVMGNDFVIDNSKITIALVSDRTYEQLQGEEKFYFAGLAKDKASLENFQKQVIDDIKNHNSLDFIMGVIPTTSQLRSGVIYEELKSGKASTLGISIIISAIAVMIVAILTYKILKNQRAQIGVLKALGYSKYEIAIPYSLLLVLISLPMLMIGYFAGISAAKPMKNLYLDFYLLPDGPIVTNIKVLLVAVIVPFVFIQGLSLFIITRLLSKNTIELLKVGEKESLSKINRWVLKLLSRASAQKKYKYSFIFRNTGKFILFFLGISFSAMLILLSFMMNGFFDKMTVDYYEETAYVYEGYRDLTKSSPGIRIGDEKFLSISNGLYNDKSITMKGLLADNKLHKLYNSKQQDITRSLKEGVIVNKSFSIMYDIKKGDEIEIEFDGRIYNQTVVNVSKDYGESIIYWELENLSKVVTNNKSKSFYSGVYSKEPLNEKKYGVVVSKEDIMDQAALMQTFIKIALYGMIASAIFISVLVLYVLTSLTIEDNYYNIALLKVMGYNKKEVGNMILNSYLVYAIMTYLLNIPMTVLGVKAMVKYYSKAFHMVMPLEFELWHGVLGLILVVIIFLLGSYAAKKRVEGVPLQEVLKAYRE